MTKKEYIYSRQRGLRIERRIARTLDVLAILGMVALPSYFIIRSLWTLL